jgi:ABC-type transport system involved in Fe-S cluster assembly fused permease/ATPase subunit
VVGCIGALHVVDGRQLGIDQQIDVAQQVLQEGITLLVKGGLVALHAISPLGIVERERRGGLMVHFRAIMCCCVVPLALLLVVYEHVRKQVA